MEVQITEDVWPKTLFEDDEPREKGIHLGQVIKSLENAAGLGYKGSGFNDMQLTAEVGLLWERALSKIMGEKYGIRPPQMKLDGIWMSPDGIGPDPAGEVPMALEEYKATWKSTKQMPEENFYYMCQVKSYCHALDTPIAIMRIFYLMGNYRGSGPQYRIARYKFTHKELKDNWAMIVQHKESHFAD